jgi:hypothetical protein
MSKVVKESLNLDSSNRIKYDGQDLNYEFSSYHNCLPLDAKVIDNLKHDCLKAYNGKKTIIDNDVSPSDYHSSGSTYFQRADVPPKSCLEDLALQIFNFHTKDAIFKPECSGAEFWTQVVDCKDDIGFHWDRDYGLESDTGVNVYPHLATVTYLTNLGGPTFIVKKVGSVYSQDDHSGETNEIVINKPIIGKHIKFDGRLLHAAPALDLVDLNIDPKEKIADRNTNDIAKLESEHQPKRITFLVNIWLNHIPIQAQSYPIDAINDFISPVLGLKGSFLNISNSKKDLQQQKNHIVATKSNKSSSNDYQTENLRNKVPSISISSQMLLGKLDLHSWIFINGGIKYRISIPLPSGIGLASLCNSHNAFNLKYAKSGVEVKIDMLDEEDTGNCNYKKRKRKIMWTPFHKNSFSRM